MSFFIRGVFDSSGLVVVILVFVPGFVAVKHPLFPIDVEDVEAFSSCIHYHIFGILKKFLVACRSSLFVKDFGNLVRKFCNFKHLLVVKLISKWNESLIKLRAVALIQLLQVLIQNKGLLHEICCHSSKDQKPSFTFLADILISPASVERNDPLLAAFDKRVLYFDNFPIPIFIFYFQICVVLHIFS
jgi:hypothetical protein